MGLSARKTPQPEREDEAHCKRGKMEGIPTLRLCEGEWVSALSVIRTCPVGQCCCDAPSTVSVDEAPGGLVAGVGLGCPLPYGP